MIRINCDIGERGAEHPVDVELMKYIDIANIACGGHAGDEDSVAAFRYIAERLGVGVSAHLSYPDRKNFGRRSMHIDHHALEDALDSQYELMPDVKTIKFHGALYTNSAADVDLARLLGSWLHRHDVEQILAPPDSHIAHVCAKLDIQVLREGYAERTYAWNRSTMQLRLTDRSLEYAVIRNCDDAMEQIKKLVDQHQVNAYVDAETNDATGHADIPHSAARKHIHLVVETVCIHSDSLISLELAKQFREFYG